MHSMIPPGPSAPHSPGSCVIAREILDRVGDKWSLLAMALLGQGPLRFSELKRTIDGISQRMLTLTLRSLERDGLVHRSVTLTRPLRVDYRLTDLGRTLLDPVHALVQWAETHGAAIQEARDRFDAGEAPS